MAHGYTANGNEWMGGRLWDGVSVDILLYRDNANNNGDDLGDDATLADIGTEPTDGNYARVTTAVSDPTVATSGVETRVEFGEVTFDLTDTTGEIDAFGIVVTIDGTPTLVGTGPLDDVYDLENYSGTWTLPVGATHTTMY